MEMLEISAAVVVPQVKSWEAVHTLPKFTLGFDPLEWTEVIEGHNE